MSISSNADDGRFTKLGKSRAPIGSGSIVRNQDSTDLFFALAPSASPREVFLFRTALFSSADFGTSPVSKGSVG